MPGVVAIDLAWELEPDNFFPGVETTITLDTETTFTGTSRALDGSGLWRLAVFGSGSPRGSGPRTGEKRQVLNRLQAGTTFTPGEPLVIDGITTDFDIGSIGCTDEVPHICVEFTKGDSPDPDYPFWTIDPSLGTDESIISCREQPCGAKAIFFELQLALNEPDIIMEYNPNKLVVDLTAFRHPKSTNVTGADLWKAKSYFSPVDTDRGPKYDVNEDVLWPDQKDFPLNYDEDLPFPGTIIFADLRDVTCNQVQYFCMELGKDARASIDYEFETIPEQDPFVTCVDIRDRCKAHQPLPCFSLEAAVDEIDRIANTNVTGGNIEEVVRDLALVTTQTDVLGTDEINDVTEALESIVNTGSSSPEVTGSVIAIINNIMNVEEEQLQKRVGKGDAVSSLEQQISNVQQDPENFTQVQENVGVFAIRVDPAIARAITFVAATPSHFSDAERINTGLSDGSTRLYNGEADVEIASTASIYIPPYILDISKEGNSGNIPISFLIYKDARLFQTKQTSPDTDTSLRKAISSQVIAARVENVSIDNLPRDSPVVIRFLTVDPLEENEVAVSRACVYWEYPEGDKEGYWSEDGCRLASEDTQIVCYCNHLTSFAVMVGIELHAKAERVLSGITITGTCLSIIGLIIYIMTLVIFKKMRELKMTKMRINTCVSLLAFYVTFLFSDLAVNSETHCRNFATAIHYLCLTTVCWMTAEAVFLYYKCITLTQSRTVMTYFLPVSLLLAYGLPLVPTIIVFLAADYEVNNYCFLPTGMALFLGFLAEVVTLVGVNTFIFIALVRKIVMRKNMATSAGQNKKEVLRRIEFLVIIWILLGLSWVFGFLAMIPNRKTVVFEVLFCIFTSFQGFFLFVIGCVRNKDVQQKFVETRSRYSDLSDTRLTRASTKSKSESHQMKKRTTDMDMTHEKHDTTGQDASTENHDTTGQVASTKKHDTTDQVACIENQNATDQVASSEQQDTTGQVASTDKHDTTGQVALAEK